MMDVLCSGLQNRRRRGLMVFGVFAVFVAALTLLYVDDKEAVPLPVTTKRTADTEQESPSPSVDLSLQESPQSLADARSFVSETFGFDGDWSDLAMPNIAGSVMLSRRAHGGGYFTTLRRAFFEKGRMSLCERVPTEYQTLPSALHTDVSLCYFPFVNAPIAKGTARLGCIGMYVLRPVGRGRLNVCNMSDGVRISPSKYWATGLRDLAGPLHLRLYLEGPELIVGHVQFDSSTCTYYVHFRLGSPGSYHVNFKVQHADFWGVDETLHRTKHNYNKYIVSRGAPNLQCYWSLHHVQRAVVPIGVPQESTAARSFAAAIRRIGGADVWDDATATLGRWVQRPYPHTLFGGRVLRASTYQFLSYAADVIGVSPALAPPYGLAPVKGRPNLVDDDLLGAPASHALRPPQLVWHTESAIRKCMQQLLVRRSRPSAKRPVRLFISGDSQSRSVYWALKDYFATVERYGDAAGDALAEVAAAGGITRRQLTEDGLVRGNISKAKGHYSELASEGESYNPRDKEGQKIKFASTNFFMRVPGEVTADAGTPALLHVYYEWDSYLDHLSANVAAADVVIAGFGSHPASWGQWSYAKFKRRASEIAAVLCREAVVHRKPVIYYGNPAWPKMKLVDNFRATNLRLGIFNGIAVAAIERECRRQLVASSAAAGTSEEKLWNDTDPTFPVQIADFFDLSLAMLKQSKDGSHFDGSVVMSTLAHRMISMVCTLRR